MVRRCFLCQSEVNTIFSAPWPLPGLDTKDIGFSVCPNCGSVCQSPSVSFAEMMNFYESVAVYTNPGRQEKPSEAKVRDLDEQIQFIRRGIGTLPESMLQIGSSDGYTLWRFKEAGINTVLGVEPGTASVDICKRLYDIPCIHASAEDFHTADAFELILLTHVIEHLYEPQKTLAKCRQIQDKLDEGFIYVEVPLMGPTDSLNPGFFSFEHINYYTRGNLIKSLLDVGYFPVSTIEHFNSNLSPIIGVLASTKTQYHFADFNNEFEQNKKIVQDYRRRELAYWQHCLRGIEVQLEQPGRLYLWGAGIHTCQLIANTDLAERYQIDGLVDTSSLKWGLQQGEWRCLDPETIDWRKGDKIIISSYASEKEIFDALTALREKGVATLRLHNIDDSKAH